jgi:hypothetical protein
MSEPAAPGPATMDAAQKYNINQNAITYSISNILACNFFWVVGMKFVQGSQMENPKI